MKRENVIEEIRIILLDRQKELTDQVLKQDELDNLHAEQLNNELSNVDNHPGDQGSTLFEREKDQALNRHLKQELNEIGTALQKIQEGNYGRCKICQKKIPADRLYAVPTTLFCIDHVKESSSLERPIEEEVLNSSIINRKKNFEEDESTAFDAEDSWKAVEEYGSSATPSDFHSTKKDYNHMYPNSDQMEGTTEKTDELSNKDNSNDKKS